VPFQRRINVRKFTALVFIAALSLAVTPLLADDLTGAEVFLCSSSYASACFDDGDCQSGPPWNLNIPAFILVDLANKKLSTTKASGENRVTPIKNMERSEGRIVIQGVEMGRAFSILIDEASGILSAAVARDTVGVVVFGACTPAGAAGKPSN
jgi:hypothetical protein